MNWPKTLIWTVALIACAACWAVVGVAAAHPGEPKAPPPAAPATTEQVQAIADRTAAWLAVTLRAEVERKTFVLTEDVDRRNDAEFHSGGAGPDHVRLRPYLADYLIDRTPDVFLGRRFYPPGAAVVLHETLHRAATRECWGPGAGGIDVEEGIVDALTYDLMPAWGWKFWRERTFATVSYPADTAAIRAASARATGARTWRERGPRAWRRALWSQSCEGRKAMLSEVVR